MVLLKIGYQSYLLENEKGLATILNTLSKARVVTDDLRYKDGQITTKGYAKISSEMLPGFKYKKSHPCETAEVQARRIGAGHRGLTGDPLPELPAARRRLMLTGQVGGAR